MEVTFEFCDVNLWAWQVHRASREVNTMKISWHVSFVSFSRSSSREVDLERTFSSLQVGGRHFIFKPAVVLRLKVERAMQIRWLYHCSHASAISRRQRPAVGALPNANRKRADHLSELLPRKQIYLKSVQTNKWWRRLQLFILPRQGLRARVKAVIVCMVYGYLLKD